MAEPPPTPSPLLVVNPAAGGGRAARLIPWLMTALRDAAHAELAMTASPDDVAPLVEEAARAGRTRVVAVGGDGTVQAVANALRAVAPDLELGVLAAGRGNDMARSLGLPRDRDAALAAALGGRVVPLDVALATTDAGSRCFVSASGVGYDAQVAAAMAERRWWQAGSIGYLATSLNELRRFHRRPVRVALDGGALQERQLLFMAVANGPYYGNGMRICPAARPDDALLDLCVVGEISRLGILRELPGVYRGAHVGHPAVTMLRARAVRVEADEPTPVHLDGEPFGHLPLEVRIEPATLRVAVDGTFVRYAGADA